MSEFDQDLPDDQDLKEKPDDESEKEGEEEVSDARETFFQALKELKENINQESELTPPDELNVPSDPTGQPSDGGDKDDRDTRTDKIYASKSKNSGEDDDLLIPGKSVDETAENIKKIMKVLDGNFQRNIARKAFHPGGVPRTWKKMINFDEVEDVDPLDAFVWADNLSPQLPRVHRREKERLGGEIAILRDVSTSMMGVYSEWSSSVVKGVIELARSKSMRVGYVEFNHKSFKYKKNAKFFTRDYNWVFNLSSNTECSGNTNYEDALKESLSEFRGRGLRNKHILFITDGIPTSGDCDVFSERILAKKLGVCIHSIFIGSKNYPKILQQVSEETIGTQFVASKGKDGHISIERKDKFFSHRKEVKVQVDPFDKVFSN
jgi:hypothetical protein